MPDNYPDTRIGKSGERRGKEACLTLGGLSACRREDDYGGGNGRGKGGEKSAEAIVDILNLMPKGRILCCKVSLGYSTNVEQQQRHYLPAKEVMRHGTCSDGGTETSVHEELQAFAALNTATPWPITLTAKPTEETAVIRSTYVRWCERGKP